MRRSRYKKIIFMVMLFFVFFMGEEKSQAMMSTSQTQREGQVIKTTELNLNNRNFFPDNGTLRLQLKIEEDTTLIIDGYISVPSGIKRVVNASEKDIGGSSIAYLDGIYVKPGKTLTIQLKWDHFFYTYGRKVAVGNSYNDWRCYAGITVPNDSIDEAKLIIEAIDPNAGGLVALGAGSNSKEDTAEGTGAGIGGEGFQFRGTSKRSEYKNKTSDCGTIIIRSGMVYACGGCGIGSDGWGTGAGIGGGGIYKIDNEDGGSIYTAKGGTVKIYGGQVEAYGGGTYNSNKTEEANIYPSKKNYFFNSSNGFYITESLDGISNDYACGTGAGIGGGGSYINNQGHIYRQNDLEFEHWGGVIHAVGGEAALRLKGIVDTNSGMLRGGGAAIGGGGTDAEDKDMRYSYDTVHTSDSGINIYQSGYGNVNYYSRSNTYDNKSYPIYTAEKNSLSLYKSRNSEGSSGAYLGQGGWFCKGSMGGSAVGNSSYGDVSIKGTRNIFPNFPQEAYTDTKKPTIALWYQVSNQEEVNDTNNLGQPAQTSWSRSVEDAVNAAGGKIQANYKLFIQAQIIEYDSSDDSTVNNFLYTKGHGLKEIKVNSNTVDMDNMYESYRNNQKQIKVADGLYYKTVEGGYFDSEIYGSNSVDTLYISLGKLNIATTKDVTIEAKDVAGNTISSGKIEIAKYLSEGEDIDGDELPFWDNTKNPTGSTWDKVYFGYSPSGSSYQTSTAIKWKILNKTANDGTTKALFILNENSVFSNSNFGSTNNNWVNSTIRDKFNDSIYNDCFVEQERLAMLKTTKTETEDISWESSTATASSLSLEKIFLLSAKEVKNSAYGNIMSAETSLCWLRNKAGQVKVGYANFGAVAIFGNGQEKRAAFTSINSVRPATNIRADRIIYSMDASDTGVATTEGGDTVIKAVSSTRPTEYRLSVYDANRSGFSVNSIKAKAGDSMTINYSGSVSSTSNEFITVIMKDGDEVKYLGRIASKGASGEVKLKLPSDIEEKTYKVLVSNEKNNGTKKTNYGGFKVLNVTVRGSGETINADIQYGVNGEKSTNEKEAIRNALEKMSENETITTETLTIEGTSSIVEENESVTAGKLKKMTLKKKDNGTVVEEKSGGTSGAAKLTITKSFTANGEYVLVIETTLGTKEEFSIAISGIGKKKGAGKDGPYIPDYGKLPNKPTLSDILNLNGISAPSALATPTAPGSVEAIGETVTVETLTINKPEINRIELKNNDLAFINWKEKANIDWSSGQPQKTEWRYKDVGASGAKDESKYEIVKMRSPIDTDKTVYILGNTESYVVKYKNLSTNTSGVGYNDLTKYTNEYKQGGTKQMGEVTVEDIPYVGNQAISISCEKSGNTIKAKLTPSNLINGPDIKEVGVRVEYTLNGIITGLVRKTNIITGKGGVFEFEFANLPSSYTCSAYYIDSSNKEFSSSPI